MEQLGRHESRRESPLSLESSSCLRVLATECVINGKYR